MARHLRRQVIGKQEAGKAIDAEDGADGDVPKSNTSKPHPDHKSIPICLEVWTLRSQTRCVLRY